MRACLLLAALESVFGAATVNWDSALAGISNTPRVSRENCVNLKEIAIGHAKAKGPISHTMASTMGAEALVNAIRAMPKLNAKNCDTAFGYNPKWSKAVHVAPLIGNGICRGPASPDKVTCLTNPATVYLECRQMCVNDPSCNCFSVATTDFTALATPAIMALQPGNCAHQPTCLMYTNPAYTYAFGSWGSYTYDYRGIYASFVVHRGTSEHSPSCTTDAPAALFTHLGYPCSLLGPFCTAGTPEYNLTVTNTSTLPTFMGNQTRSYTNLQLIIANCPVTCAQAGQDPCALLDSIV